MTVIAGRLRSTVTRSSCGPARDSLPWCSCKLHKDESTTEFWSQTNVLTVDKVLDASQVLNAIEFLETVKF